MAQQIIPLSIRVGKANNTVGSSLTDIEFNSLDEHVKAIGLSRSEVIAGAIDGYLQLEKLYHENPSDDANPFWTFFSAHFAKKAKEG